MRRKVEHVIASKIEGIDLAFDVDLCVVTALEDPELTAVLELGWNCLIGFYAGAAIVDEQGYALGALCITDRHARQLFSAEEKSRLVALSARISAQVG